MLDIRAVAYVSPVAEVPFTDVALTVHLVNYADETGYVTGLFRVYNDTTGELIFSSEILPISLSAGASADVSALTQFSPPAPADDVYFVLFTGQAVNDLVPDGIALHLGAWHFDVKPGPLGEPPAAHAVTHEQAGADPIEPADLGTSELDTALRLAPDGAGGVSWSSQAGYNPLVILTTVQMNALVASEGMLIYNSDWHCPALYDGVAWVQVALANP